jgi:hypothetical protein
VNQLPARLGEGAGAEPLLPLPLAEMVAAIKAGGAVDAFAAKRAVQILTHGHTPEKDLERPIGVIAIEAKHRLDALTEIVGGYNGRMNLPRERREQCLRYIEITGGLLLSLWDRVQVEIDHEA